MTVLVTGASGFLGGRVAGLLVEDHQVVATGRRFPRERHDALTAAGVRVVVADLTDPDALDRLLEGVAAVVHCAAMSTLWGRWADLQRINIDVPSRIAACCAARGIRLVHISSPSIYNRAIYQDPTWGSAERPVPETLTVGPLFDSDYAKSKWLAEQAVLAACPEACILRPRGLYGPGDNAVMPRVIAALRSGRLPRLVVDDVLTDLTHVDNAAHAARLAVASSVSGPVNIADGTPTAIWAGIDQVADALGVARPQRRLPAGLVEAVASGNERLARTLGRGEPRLTVVGIRLLTRGVRLDLTRARTELGYTPICTDGLISALSACGTSADSPATVSVSPASHPATGPGPTLVLEHLQAGWCVSLGALAQRGEPWRIRRFAAGATLIRHPEHGLVLFDTGYSRAALEAIRHWPAWPYGHLLPVRLPPGQALVEQFAARDEANAVQAIICSHLHMDHLSGAVDFPHAPVWMDPADITTLASYDGFAAVRHGVVPAIRPAARRLRPFRYSPAPAWLAPFTRAMDFFGDQSLWIVPSPGHTDGSVAAIARTQTDNTEGAGLVLLAGDVAWSERSLRQGIEPHWLTSRAVIHDLAAGRASSAGWRRWLARHRLAKVVVSHETPVA